MKINRIIPYFFIAVFFAAPVFANSDPVKITFSGSKILYMGEKFEILRISFGNNATFEEIKTKKIDTFKEMHSGKDKYIFIETDDKKRVISISSIVQILADEDKEIIHIMLN